MAETNLNLNFKHGTQASLNGLTTSDKGTFYLTNDTNRLYIGTGAAPALLNQTVQIVANFDNLPTDPAKNDFYYLTKENVLAVYTDSGWTQINKDTNTDTKVSEISFTKNSQSNDSSLIYDVSISLKDINGGNAGNITTTLTLNSADIANLVPEAASVGLAVEDASNKATIKTKGDGSDSSSSISIAASGLADVSVSDNTITINVDSPTVDHTLSTDGTSVKLTKPSGGYDSVSFSSGTDLEVNNVGGAITYAHKSYNTTDSAQSNTYISGLTIENGHITKVTRTQLPIDQDTTNTELTLNGTTLTLTDSNGDSVTQDLSDLVTSAVKDSKDYTDGKLAALESVLDYKGSADQTTTPATSSKGDTYLAGIDNAFGTGAKVGDLLVYNGESWDIIPSGDELNTDTTYAVNFESETFSIKESGGTVIGSLAVANGDGPITVSSSVDESKQNGTITIDHNTVKSDGTEVVDSSTDTKNYEYRAITGINVDKYGHVAGYQTSGFNSKTYTLTGANSKITLTDDSGTTNDIGVAGDGVVSASVANNTISLSHAKPNITSATDAKTITHGSVLPIVTYEVNDYGHVTKKTTTNYTLPSETTYSFNYGKNSVSLETGSGTSKGTISINGSGNVTVASTNGAFGIGLVWGTF